MSGARDKSELFASLPPVWPHDLLPEIRRTSQRKLVVLDDDPTGTQTVRDIPVLTTWTVAALAAEFSNDLACFYILTNTRAFPRHRAEEINREIARNLNTAAGTKEFVVVSRGDSTLRGHFPAETNALRMALNRQAMPTLIVPYFEAGGRYTIHDIHYVQEDESLIPAAETPFARDSAFGYQNSNLREWVEEMTSGAVKADAVTTLTIDEIRHGGPESVFSMLISLNPGSICIANAASPRDLEVIALASLRAEEAGATILYRTAASFVSARLGLESSSPWSPPEARSRHGGLTVVGSYVPQTTAQLEPVLGDRSIARVELSVESILDPATRASEISNVQKLIEESISSGQDVVAFTSRKLLTDNNAERSLSIGGMISHALVEVVKNLSVHPRYIIAKGGITSSDLATKALGITRALVLGQILPGIPVWQAGPESKFPGVPYIVFPGNVGKPDALYQAITILKNS